MKKWIKKLLISSGAITLVGTGGVGTFIGAKQTKQTENLKAIIKDRDDDYIFLRSPMTKNRTHELILSFSSVAELYKLVDQKTTIKKQGDTIFNYLTTSWANILCEWFSHQMKQYSDYGNIHSLFEQTNTYTWRGGFVVSNFMKILEGCLKDSAAISINIYVDDITTGHNLYGTKFWSLDV